MAGEWDVVAGAFGFGGPSGNDHGSSNWAAWGHAEIRSMLDSSVDPADIGEAAWLWREQGRNAADVITGCIRDLNGLVSGGWRGESAEVAITALAPIEQWSASVVETADRSAVLMDASGSSAGQAKVSVPPPQSHNLGAVAAQLRHRRPSYLVEMDDVFTDGRKVAPPVIGADPPERTG